MIRILLVDDHPVVRHGIRAILTDRFQDAVVAEAGDAPSALREVDNAEWDVVLLDITMPSLDAVSLPHAMPRRPRCPIVLFSDRSERELALLAEQSGAAGYIRKTAETDQLIGEVERILSLAAEFCPPRSFDR